MKKIIAFVLIIAATIIPLSTYPTCIVTLRDSMREGIIVAADQLETFKDGHRQKFCKIQHVNNYYYTLFGAAGEALWYLADSFLNNVGEPTPEKIMQLDKRILPVIRKFIQDNRYGDPSFFKQADSVGHDVVVSGINFIYYVGNNPQFRYAGIDYSPAKHQFIIDTNIVETQYWAGLYPDGAKFRDRLMAEHKETIEQLCFDIVAFVIQHHPDKCGGDVDEIRISPNQPAQWITAIDPMYEIRPKRPTLGYF